MNRLNFSRFGVLNLSGYSFTSAIAIACNPCDVQRFKPVDNIGDNLRTGEFSADEFQLRVHVLHRLHCISLKYVDGRLLETNSSTTHDPAKGCQGLVGSNKYHL